MRKLCVGGRVYWILCEMRRVDRGQFGEDDARWDGQVDMHALRSG